MKRTIVFYKIRHAIHQKCPECKGESPTWPQPDKCEWCLGSGRKYKYIKLTGSSRSSKTTSAIQNFYSEAWNEENKRFSVWRDTKKDCKDTVGEDMTKIFPTMPYYSPGTVTFNKTESIYSFPAGSKIEICGTDDQDKVHGYNGDVAWLNEPYKISKATFDHIDMRTTMFVVIDMNPKENHWSDDLEKDKRCIVIHSTFLDNPHCPAEQKAKILSYQPVSMCSIVIEKILPEAEAKAYNLTENPLKLSEKQIKELARCKENERKNSASAFNWSVYGLGLKAERPNRIFHWTEISDDEYNAIDATEYFGSDWGVVDPWAVPKAKYLDGCLYVKELNYMSENQIKELLTIPELEQVNAKEEGLIGWLFEKIFVPKEAVVVCDDNRPLKVKALREAGYDYAITAIKGQGSVIDGIDLLLKLKVFFTSSSVNLKLEQENYSRLTDRYGIVLETPEDANCHLIDVLRYIVVFLKVQGIIKII